MDLEAKEMSAEIAADLGYEDLQHDLFAQRLR